jgi:hypothetical protein
METMFVFELTILLGFMVGSFGIAGFTVYTGKNMRYGVIYGMLGLLSLLLFILVFAENPETWKLIVVLLVAFAGLVVAVLLAVLAYLRFVLR